MFRYSKPALNWAQLIHRNVYQCYIPHLVTNHCAQLTVKATRRLFLKKAVLNQNKDVIYAEPRQPTDLVMKLKQAGKCPGVIIPFSKNKDEEVDVVLPGKAMKTKYISPDHGLQRVYVRVAGQEFCCVLRAVKMNPLKHFIQKVYFYEYVPGQPNHLRIPIRIINIENSTFFHEGYDYNVPFESIDIICYNYEYPTRFYIDVSYVNPDRPYTLGDLANTFPPGVILNSKVDPSKTAFQFVEPEGGLQSGDDSLDQVLASIKASNQQAKGGSSASTTATSGGSGGEAGKTAAAPADAGKKK